MLIKKKKYKILLTLTICIGLFFLIALESNGQVPVINTPHASTLLPNGTVGSSNVRTALANPSNQQQLDIYEQDRRQVEQRNVGLYESGYTNAIQYDLPSNADIPSTEYFRKA